MTSMLGHIRNAATSRTKVKDHQCNVGYPITVHTSATAVDVGNVRDPLPVGAWALHFGAGHPLNGSGPVIPASEQYASPYQTTSSVSVGSVSRRAELVSAIEALVAIKDFYGGDGVRGVCAHVYTDSIYVAKLWGEWLEMWERNGWPGEGEEPEPTVPIQDRRPTAPGLRDSGIAMSNSSHGSPASRTSNLPSVGGASRARSYSRQSAKGVGSIKAASSIMSANSDVSISMSSPHLFTARGRPFDEDLMRELAELREYFGELQRGGKGGCYFYAASRGESPAWNLSRELARQSGAEVLRTAGQSRRRRPTRGSNGDKPPSILSQTSRTSRTSRSAPVSKSGMVNSTSWKSDSGTVPDVPAIPSRHAQRSSRVPNLPACEASPTMSIHSDPSSQSPDASLSATHSSEGRITSSQSNIGIGAAAPIRGALKNGATRSSSDLRQSESNGSRQDTKNRHVARFSAVSPVPESPAPRAVDLPGEMSAQPSGYQPQRTGPRTSRRVSHYATKEEASKELDRSYVRRTSNRLPEAAEAAGWSTEQIDSDESDIRHSGPESHEARQLKSERHLKPDDVPQTGNQERQTIAQLEREPKKKGFLSRLRFKLKA
ncbi:RIBONUCLEASE H1 [Ceraceosorus bombacis]|uniref:RIBONUCLEASE H1 n=1 Tax=Ceraceosorus bombacis TaxID=401625 RepID=A0A0P1BA30_9BASI|nr:RIBONUCLEASE H1 [Ceraceosorus bombacis]